jgi:hypothetical protein
MRRRSNLAQRASSLAANCATTEQATRAGRSVTQTAGLARGAAQTMGVQMDTVSGDQEGLVALGA